MKKQILIFAVAVAAICGCHDGQEPAVQSPTGEMIVTGMLDTALSRTTIASDGINVNWSAGDRIGVYTALKGNVEFTLQEGAGTITGTFAGGTPADGAAQYAYYPYSSAATADPSAVKLSLATVQDQDGSAPEIGANDFKAGASLGGGKFAFRNVMSMLEVDLTAGPLAGDALKSVTFKAAGCRIAGSFTMDITSSPAVPLFASDVTSSDCVRLDFLQEPSLEAAEVVRGWMIVGSTVPAGTPLEITVTTDRHVATVNVEATKALEAGYQYTLPLDIASLVSRGLASIENAASPFLAASVCGIYGNVDSTCDGLLLYEGGRDQLVAGTTSSGRFFRIVDFAGGWAVTLGVPSSLEVGSQVTLTTAVVGIPAVSLESSYTLDVVKVSEEKVWLSEPSFEKGFIITTEQ